MRNNLVLASASPRRLALLQQIKIEPAQTLASSVDETPLKSESGDALALRLAEAKARNIAEKYPGMFVLGADTVVACGRKILPKAESEEDVRACLARLSGRRHHVYGGIALVAPGGKIVTRLCETLVQFKKLARQETEDYIRSGEWQGKAGGYAIQGHAEGFIKFIRGSYSNVVGLSLYDTLQMLQGSGYFKP